MDSVTLYVILFATGWFYSMCMALDCNWKTEYEYRGRCETCPSGEYPVQHSRENHQILCKQCAEKSDHCFCNNILCANDKCSKCSSSPHCKQGEELRRTGLFYFTYICEPCLNQTYNDEEDKMCKPVLDCRKLGLRVMFPGNRTHNARCDCSEINNHDGVVINKGLLVCFAITVLLCLAMLIYLCIQKTKKQKIKVALNLQKKHPPTSSSLKVAFDEFAGYKLSKEEMGEV